ncbi:hypothetical protein QAD02_013040 [Eretmocerus hayati]|uniref:Uncharacterized protein n=1 Tax=Eretmocerus hayati TaxID=131215 RepID=A0ACC2P2B8_9HYME|nr:hypothetical protein QAD02_013040 [Eretmocerus hayati]
MDQPKFPLSICTSCRLSLLSREKNHFERSLPVMPNYLDILLLDDVICYCYICLTGQSTGHLKPRSSWRSLQNHRVTIEPSNGPYSWLNVPRVSEANKKNSRGRKSILKRCDECHQIVGRGIRHACKANGSNARDNCINLLKNLPKNKEDQVVMNVLKRRLEENSMPENENGNKKYCDGVLELSSLDSRSKIAVNPPKRKNVQFAAERLSNFQNNTGVSTIHMGKMVNFLRSHAGRASVPGGTEKELSKYSKRLKDLYQYDILEFDTDKKGKEMRPVVWADAEKLLKAVQEYRDELTDPKIKIMADSGQGFFKISLSIFEIEKNEAIDFDRKKCLYSEGGSLGRKNKLTSVQGLILLYTVPQVKESYKNLNFWFELTNFNNIPFEFIADFKVYLTCVGQQTASASYPSPICSISLEDLKNQDVSDDVEHGSHGSIREL